MGTKVFVYALEGEPETLDPGAKFYSERATRIKWLLYDALINLSGDGRRLEPGLAEKWTLSHGGLRATLTLRADVVFHDRTPLDAHAVQVCFERQFATDLNDPKKQVLRELIAEIQIQDPLTLVFNLKYPGFEYLAQRYLYKLGVVSPIALAKLGKDFARSPIGTGPFQNPVWLTDRIILSRNAAYWDGAPRIDQVHFRFIPDGREAVDQLLTGDVDFIPSLSDPDAIQRVLSDDRVRVQVVPGYNVYYLAFSAVRPPSTIPPCGGLWRTASTRTRRHSLERAPRRRPLAHSPRTCRAMILP
jgi:peptide/nickel transport system substrate-binding protein